ncbi:MAG: ATP-dependent DNA helicase RecG [Nitrospirae bacterium]|nr:ATP-dependent DNA helicase RecG [Nitrospirota bacterium]
MEENPGIKPRSLRDTSAQYIKGVGPRRARLLERLGIRTIEDLLFYIPWRYEDRKNLRNISNLSIGNHETLLAEVVSADIITTPRKKMKILEIVVTDGSGFLKCKWFNQPYLGKYFRKGQKVILSGVVKGYPDTNRFRPALGPDFGLSALSSGPEMENPDFENLDNEDGFIHTSRIIPIYRATEGFTPKQLRTLIFSTITQYSPLIKDYMPEDIIIRNQLVPLKKAVKEVHFPEEFSDINVLNQGLSPVHRRLIFDEFFLLELGLAMMKKKEEAEAGISFKRESALVDKFLKTLHFELTNAQIRVFDHIRQDMTRTVSMNWLIHGDVGCGKTVIAVLSMLMAVDSGYQACLMAPTEILAEQHFINMKRMLDGFGLDIILVTSSTKKQPMDMISGGKAQIIIGTHSLIQEQMKFKNLGLAVIDEQHKFGVVQRANLRRKGFNPDILIMTATPIPRTLALTLYGDLDISVIDELPAGRRPVQTKVFFPSQKDRAYSLIHEELSKGRQVYIVYPLIEGSEKLDLKCAVEGAEALRKIFPGKKIGLVHGRVRQDEREKIMSSFKAGDIDMLAATTVIEVGVDVPNASLMLIVHAERFGLAQLHQLRGRIGRGGYESHCLLMAYPPFGEDAKRRLKAMTSTNDGFKIAEQDLDIRGPGEFFGTRQSGIPELRIANLIRDIGILESARNEAFALTGEDPVLKKYPLLRDTLYTKWRGRLELIKS